jgi:hypothetical protein
MMMPGNLALGKNQPTLAGRDNVDASRRQTFRQPEQKQIALTEVALVRVPVSYGLGHRRIFPGSLSMAILSHRDDRLMART